MVSIGAEGGRVRVLSLGWGVQSFTLAAMSALGELEPLDAAIHADTGYEREATYAFSEKWTPWLRERHVEVITATNPQAVVEPSKGNTKFVVYIPAFTDGSAGQLKRQCTNYWKLRPLKHEISHLLYVYGQTKRPGAVEVWIGISADEWTRAKDAKEKYLSNRFPLLERNMTRADCKAWLLDHGLDVPPKSSCTFCPFQSRGSWRELKRRGGHDWHEALGVDAEIRQSRPPWPLYVHPARRPLAEAVDIPEDHGYVQTGFDPEGRCDEGVCWV